jgi:hypothetical protein
MIDYSCSLLQFQWVFPAVTSRCVKWPATLLHFASLGRGWSLTAHLWPFARVSGKARCFGTSTQPTRRSAPAAPSPWAPTVPLGVSNLLHLDERDPVHLRGVLVPQRGTDLPELHVLVQHRLGHPAR